MEIKVGKKNGSVESFDEAKVERAIRLASDRIGRKLNPVEIRRVIGLIEDEITQTFVHVSEMHKIVCRVLKETYPDVAQSYQNFRDYKLTYVKDLEKLFEESKNTLKYGDRENANFDSALISTKGSLLRGYLTKLLYTKYYLHKDEAEATRLGTIYIHDMRDMVMQSFNCFSGDTKFISDHGLRTFKSLGEGAVVYVPTHKGRWKKAVVHKYGKQQLQWVFLKRGASKEKKIAVTQNHRWILRDGTETTNLKVGDYLHDTPRISKFDWDSLSLTDKRIWCMGFNLGDGSYADNASYLRLCGEKVKYAERFIDAGFNVTYPEYYEGDGRVYMYGIRKEIPYGLLHRDNFKVFVNGLMCADGSKNPETRNSEFRGITIAGDMNEKDVKGLLSAGGYYVTNMRDDTNTPTNFGNRTKTTINYQTYEYSANRPWKVVRIEECKRKLSDVWCLVVEDDHSFMLEGGIVTGNCDLFDIGEVLRGGFEMANIRYKEPNSVLSALQVTGDVTLSASAQQSNGLL